jgi:hypothetical protein
VSRFTLVYPEATRFVRRYSQTLAPTTCEDEAVIYAQAESGTLRCDVSVWQGTTHVASFRNGVAYDLPPAEYAALLTFVEEK